jgi:hypothetical protein
MYQARLFPLFAAIALLGGCGGTPEVESSDQLHVSCLAKPDAGNCRGARPAFYYDYHTDSCRRFLYGGCGGNVPFATLEDCVKRCGGRPQP